VSSSPHGEARFWSLNEGSLALTQANTVMTSWFYWSEAHRNVKGEELATCLYLYGTSERDQPASFEAGALVVVHARCTRVVVTD
jgi:hypothetical protein